MVNSTLDRSYSALAHPVRRRIVDRLSSGPATVAEAMAGMQVTKPAMTKHVRVLEEAGLIVRKVEGRQHWLSLRPRPLEEAGAWIERHRAIWQAKFAAVERHLAREDGKGEVVDDA
jgi:DNA-binding transcriptional ArsR family regulator